MRHLNTKRHCIAAQGCYLARPIKNSASTTLIWRNTLEIFGHGQTPAIRHDRNAGKKNTSQHTKDSTRRRARVNFGVVPPRMGTTHAKLWAPVWWWRARRQQNPLLRRWSPTERLAASVVGLVALVGILAIAVMMAVVNIAGMTRSQQETQARHQVSATVLNVSADPVTDASIQGAASASYTEQVSWTWRNRAHVGEQSSVVALPAGTTTTVWVDDAGELAMTPWSTSDTATAVLTVGAAGTVATALLTVLAWLVFDRWLTRRRAELWQVEWAQLAPIWSGHTHP